jgi:hypothetical protein
MGMILTGRCKSCGFKTEFSFGGDKKNCTTVCMLPAIDKETGEFVELNYYDFQNLESKYLFYNDEKLKTNDLESNFQFRSFEVLINQRDNFCPKCQTYGLNFFLKYLTD